LNWRFGARKKVSWQFAKGTEKRTRKFKSRHQSIYSLRQIQIHRGSPPIAIECDTAPSVSSFVSRAESSKEKNPTLGERTGRKNTNLTNVTALNDNKNVIFGLFCLENFLFKVSSLPSELDLLRFYKFQLGENKVAIDVELELQQIFLDFK